LEITGGLFATTAAAATDATGSAVVAINAAGATALGSPLWRRATAATIHDTGDSIGAPGPDPNNGDSTESTFAVAGACTMTGAATVGATDSGATVWAATGRSCFVAARATGRTAGAAARITACTRAVRGVELALGSAVTRSGIATAAADGGVFLGGVSSGRADAVVRGVDPEPPRRAPVSVAGRLHRVRVVGPAESARADEATSVPVSEGSAGVAQADPAPPVTTAAPIPSATARPPTRPTWADARFTLNLPTALRTSARQRKDFDDGT
jgi:hypothetical protein